MEIEIIDHKYKEQKIKLTSATIIGINGCEISYIENLLTNKKGILTNKKNIDEDEYYQFKKNICTVREHSYINISKNTIFEIMESILSLNKIYPKNKEKKITDSLKIVGINKDILSRNINTLSKSETKLLQIAISLLLNPEIIVIEEPFKYLDLKNIKKIMLVFRKLKEQYNKIIVFISKDTEKLYQNTDNMIFYTKECIYQKSTKEAFQNVDFLVKNNIEIPQIIDFTHKTRKNKRIKIDYHQDVRDIIKDIYKHI